MTDADKKPFAQVYTRLAVAFEKESDEVTMRVYFNALKDQEIEFLAGAAERWIDSEKWFPKVSEWRAGSRKFRKERVDAQQAFLRALPEPLCALCNDTSWREDKNECVRPCECREARRNELLGRQPWPALPEAQTPSEAAQEP